MTYRRPPQILALGGGMFSMEPDNGLLDKYLLNMVPVKKPKICFLGTASSDGTEYREMFYDFFTRLNCEPTHLALTEPPENIETIIMKQDIIHVGGGNTRLIMDSWKKHRVDKIMKKAWRRGIVLSGMSAGAICWFKDGFMTAAHGALEKLPCLGLLKGSFCPHYDDRAELRRSYKHLIVQKVISEGFGVEDGAALHFVGNNLLRVVSSRPNATAYKVTLQGVKAIEEKLDSFYLGKESDLSERETEIKERKTLETAVSFVQKINEHDLNGLAELMSDDYKYIDSMDNEVSDNTEVMKAWRMFLSWFPDYEIEVRHALMTDDTVGFFGRAKGTFGKKRPGVRDKFDIPASWRAKIKDGKVSEWQSIADNESVRFIIDINGRYEFIERLEKEKLKHKKH